MYINGFYQNDKNFCIIFFFEVIFLYNFFSTIFWLKFPIVGGSWYYLFSFFFGMRMYVSENRVSSNQSFVIGSGRFTAMRFHRFLFFFDNKSYTEIETEKGEKTERIRNLRQDFTGHSGCLASLYI